MHGPLNWIAKLRFSTKMIFISFNIHENRNGELLEAFYLYTNFDLPFFYVWLSEGDNIHGNGENQSSKK